MTNATETRAEHTPGPWKRERTVIYSDASDEYPRPMLVQGTLNASFTDLNLMAAAPELLKAVEEAYHHHVGHTDTCPAQGSGECICFRSRLRTAIAKAKGETHE